MTHAICYILIGMNLGMVVGWIICKKANGDIKIVMDWFDK